jgi:hypothetical protein
LNIPTGFGIGCFSNISYQRGSGIGFLKNICTRLIFGWYEAHIYLVLRLVQPWQENQYYLRSLPGRLVSSQVPTRQVLVRGWYCFRSYQSCRFFDTRASISLYTHHAPTWYPANTMSPYIHTDSTSFQANLKWQKLGANSIISYSPMLHNNPPMLVYNDVSTHILGVIHSIVHSLAHTNVV